MGMPHEWSEECDEPRDDIPDRLISQEESDRRDPDFEPNLLDPDRGPDW
jgi:hypothetical protein